MSAIPRPHRAAYPGEIVNFFEDGDPSSAPIPALVNSEYGGNATLTYHKPGDMTPKTKTVKHIHDPYWDAVSLANRQSCGAYDFHPVYKGVFDKWLTMADAREAQRLKRESERNELSVDEYNAITALERHGDNMTAIVEETGMTPIALKKLKRFNEELNKVKEANFAAKNE